MTPDELPADMEGWLQWALLSFGAGQGHIAVSAPDLRALLKAYQEQRRALEQTAITLRMLKRNIETEIKRYGGMHRWEGVPEAIQARIDDAEDAIATTAGGD